MNKLFIAALLLLLFLSGCGDSSDGTPNAATYTQVMQQSSGGTYTQAMQQQPSGTSNSGSSAQSGTQSGTQAPPPTVSGWSNGSLMPTSRGDAASAVVGTDIYVVGGGGTANGFTSFEKFNTLNNLWTSLPKLPFSFFSIRGATVGGNIYVFGGVLNNNAVYRYDPSSGSWTKLHDMPSMDWMGMPAVVNNKVYIIGGHNSSGALSTVLEYDPSTDTWNASRTPMPTARYAPATAVYNNKIYVLGGNYGNNKNEVYDPTTNTWQSKADVPFDSAGWGVAGVINGKIYYTDSETSNMAVYTPETDSWSSLSGLTMPRSYPTGETVNGRLYVIGGFDSNLVDIYVP